MIRNALKNLGFQFFLIGFLVNLTFLLVLYSGETSFINIQVPENQYAYNIWASCSDVMSYVNPARNFVDYGVVGYKYTPDHFRTIGYPVFLAFFMKLDSEHWLFLLFLTQAFLYAFFYPVMLRLYELLFPGRKGGALLVWFVLLTGVYWVRTAQVLTDSLFALGLLSGVYLGLKYFISGKWIYAVAYILIITISALIRPTLSMFFVINFLLAWISLGISLNNPGRKGIFKRSVLLGVVFLITCNLATFRNIKNYNFYSPSSVVSLNLFEYLGKRVLLSNDQQIRYIELNDSISKLHDIRDVAKARKHETAKIIRDYPVSAVKEVFFKNAINLLLTNHFENVGNYYGFSWKAPRQDSVCYPYQASTFLFWFSYILMALYALLFAIFLYSLYLLVKEQQYAILCLIIVLFGLFVVPGMITGSGGARFRLPFEGFLLLLSCFGFSHLLKKANS